MSLNPAELSNSNFVTPTTGTPVQAADRAQKPASNGDDMRPAVCVFCGASPGSSPEHLEAARDLARQLHENGMTLVYGGGTSGLMGEVAKTLVSLSGPSAVHGIIPEALQKYEQGKVPIDEEVYGRTTIVKDMHTRKQMMAQEVRRTNGGFVALSGGFGTMEEIMEITTWNQLGIHNRPVVVFNVAGYYDGLISWIKGAVRAGFIAKANGGILVEAKTAEETMHALQNYEVSKARFDLDWQAEG